jgi:hypothetical protein
MEKIEVAISKEDFLSEKVYQAFLGGEQGWDWQYNIDRDIWGYGSDAEDWYDKGEKFLDTNQIISIEEKEGEKGAFIIYYED